MFLKILERLALALESRRIRYMLIGGQAVLLYGEPRLTKDIDLTLDRDAGQVDALLDLARQLGWKVLVKKPVDFVRETMVLPCLDPVSGIRIDFIFSFSPYEKQAFGRVRRVPMGRARVCFASVEDVVIHKMIAGRARDLEDVKNLLTKNRGMDLSYVRHWLKQFEQTLSRPLLARFREISK